MHLNLAFVAQSFRPNLNKARNKPQTKAGASAPSAGAPSAADEKTFADLIKQAQSVKGWERGGRSRDPRLGPQSTQQPYGVCGCPSITCSRPERKRHWCFLLHWCAEAIETSVECCAWKCRSCSMLGLWVTHEPCKSNHPKYLAEQAAVGAEDREALPLQLGAGDTMLQA